MWNDLMDEVTDLADGQLFHERSPVTAVAFTIFSYNYSPPDGSLCIRPGERGVD